MGRPHHHNQRRGGGRHQQQRNRNNNRRPQRHHQNRPYENREARHDDKRKSHEGHSKPKSDTYESTPKEIIDVKNSLSADITVTAPQVSTPPETINATASTPSGGEKQRMRFLSRPISPTL